MLVVDLQDGQLDRIVNLSGWLGQRIQFSAKPARFSTTTQKWAWVPFHATNTKLQGFFSQSGSREQHPLDLLGLSFVLLSPCPSDTTPDQEWGQQQDYLEHHAP